MNDIKTTQQLLNKFPQLGFNVNNQDINSKYSEFLKHIETKKIFLTEKNIRLYVREFFKKTFQITFPKVNKISPNFWISRGFSEEEAKIKAKEFYNSKIKNNRLLPTQLEYYIQKKGMTNEEAEKALKEEQKKRADKLVKKEEENPELRKRRIWSNIEYWTHRGYSEEQGYQLIKEKFESRNMQTMQKLVQKYIDKGFSEKESTEKAHKDYKKRGKKSKETKIKNNSFGWQKASKQSLDFFKPLMEKLDKEGIEYFVGVEGNSEWFLAKGTEYFYSYDFCIPSQKLIIEYNGEHIHPNPNMSPEEWDNWTHCWSNKSADECRKYDLKKIDVAESEGFKVIEVFENDDDVDLIDLLI